MKINIVHHHSKKCELCGEELGLVYKKEDLDKCIENIERRIKEVINMEWEKGMNYVLNEVEEIFIDEI